jgi:hypothetical protein
MIILDKYPDAVIPCRIAEAGLFILDSIAIFNAILNTYN